MYITVVQGLTAWMILTGRLTEMVAIWPLSGAVVALSFMIFVGLVFVGIIEMCKTMYKNE